jgi:hypothetical protein
LVDRRARFRDEARQIPWIGWTLLIVIVIAGPAAMWPRLFHVVPWTIWTLTVVGTIAAWLTRRTWLTRVLWTVVLLESLVWWFGVSLGYGIQENCSSHDCVTGAEVDMVTAGAGVVVALWVVSLVVSLVLGVMRGQRDGTGR